MDRTVTITLTKQQYENLVKQGHIEKKKLTEEELNDIANRINGGIDIPFIGEEAEFKLIRRAVEILDNNLYNYLPDDYYIMIRDIEDGIGQAEADVLIDRLSKICNKVIDIPFLDEDSEYHIINAFIRILIVSMKEGKKLLSSKPKY